MNTPYFNNFMPQPGQFGMPQMQAPTQQMNQIQFVNGIESAKAFTLGPNQSVILMDSNKPVFYQKQADASGFCTIKAYSFQEVKEDQPEDKYLTKAEFQEWLFFILFDFWIWWRRSLGKQPARHTGRGSARI